MRKWKSLSLVTSNWRCAVLFFRRTGPAFFIVLVVGVCGGCGGETNPAMGLQFADRVFVALDAEGLPAGAVGTRVAGDEPNFYEHFAHVETVFDPTLTAPAIVIYSNVRYIPAGTVYIPMRVVTLYQAAKLDKTASGIVVNPGINGVKNYAMTTAQIKAAISRVMQHRPLFVEIQVAG